MVTDLGSSLQSGVSVIAWLDDALVADELPGPVLERSAPARRAAAERLSAARDDSQLSSLRLRESLLYHLNGEVEQAYLAAHDSWVAIDRCGPPHVQALVLTQLAACSEARGDTRGALRAVRRAEALLVSTTREDTPQVLAVRAQLVALLEQGGQESGPAIRRRDRSCRLLAHLSRGERAARRFERMRRSLIESCHPPHWALLYGKRWRNLA